MDLPDIYVIRHGETEWNRARRWQGRLDSPLTVAGRAQAALMGRMLARLDVGPQNHAFHTSPQGRAAETARLILAAIGAGRTARPDPRLVEYDTGAFTGLTMAEVTARAGLGPDAGFLDAYRAAPGGEGFDALLARAATFLADLDGPAVIVTHGVTSRALRALALGLDFTDEKQLPGGQGVIHRISSGRHETIRPGDLGLDEA